MFPLLFVPGMTYSQSNYQTCSSFPCDSMNVFWNSKMMEMMTRPMLYSYPSYDMGSYMPYQYNFGFNPADPQTFAQQWMNQYQAQGGMGANWGGYPYLPGVGATTPTGKPDSSKKYTKAEEQELKDLEAILKAHRDITKNAKRKSTINEALSAKYAEKLEALRKAFKEIPENDIKRTLMVMKDNKTSLENAGYTFGDDYSYRNTNDTDLINKIDSIHSELVALKGEEYVAETYGGALEGVDILRLISYWNDKYNKSDERSIINLVFKKLPTKAEEKEYGFKQNIVPLVEALTNKATEVIDSLDGDTSEIKTAKEKLIEAKEKGVNNKTDIIKAFENLYILLRKAEAKRINEELQNKYEFLNDIDNNDTDIITDTLVIKDTENDLAKEFKNNTALLSSNNITVNGDGNDDGNDDDDKKPETEKTAYQNGVALSNSMRKKRTSPKNRTANDALNTVNSDNVVEFLDGLYSEKKRNYFERMDKREGKGQIDMDARKNLIKSVLDAAEKAGVDKNSDAYRKLNEIYEEYTEHNKTDKTDFKSKNTDQATWWNFKDKATAVWTSVGTCAAAGATIGGTVGLTCGLGFMSWATGPAGAILGGVVGAVVGLFTGLGIGKTTDAEVVDSCIKELYEKIKMNEQIKKEEKTETTDVQA